MTCLRIYQKSYNTKKYHTEEMSKAHYIIYNVEESLNVRCTSPIHSYM